MHEIQRITVDSEEDNLAGFFRLEFDGETSDKIEWNANAEGSDSVALALVRMSTVGTVSVVRDLSRRLFSDLECHAEFYAG